MKNKLDYRLIPGIICVPCGLILGLAQSAILAGRDESGLLVGGNPLTVCQLILTLAAMAAIFYFSRKAPKSAAFDDFFPAKRLLAAAQAGSGVLLFAAGLGELIGRENSLSLLSGLLAIAGAMATVYSGVTLFAGKKPHALAACVLCLSFIVRLVAHYRTWSCDPQLQDYCFQLLACVALMLAAYHRAALDHDQGSPRGYLFTAALAAMFCLASLFGGQEQIFYLGGLLWAAPALLTHERT